MRLNYDIINMIAVKIVEKCKVQQYLINVCKHFRSQPDMIQKPSTGNGNQLHQSVLCKAKCQIKTNSNLADATFIYEVTEIYQFY